MSVFFRGINDRMGLMGQMVKKSGLDMSQLANEDMDSDFRKVVFRCLKCKASESCVKWLAEGNEKAEAPEFCPNSEFMNQ